MLSILKRRNLFVFFCAKCVLGKDPDLSNFFSGKLIVIHSIFCYIERFCITQIHTNIPTTYNRMFSKWRCLQFRLSAPTDVKLLFWLWRTRISGKKINISQFHFHLWIYRRNSIFSASKYKQWIIYQTTTEKKYKNKTR